MIGAGQCSELRAVLSVPLPDCTGGSQIDSSCRRADEARAQACAEAASLSPVGRMPGSAQLPPELVAVDGVAWIFTENCEPPLGTGILKMCAVVSIWLTKYCFPVWSSVRVGLSSRAGVTSVENNNTLSPFSQLVMVIALLLSARRWTL